MLPIWTQWWVAWTRGSSEGFHSLLSISAAHTSRSTCSELRSRESYCCCLSCLSPRRAAILRRDACSFPREQTEPMSRVELLHVKLLAPRLPSGLDHSRYEVSSWNSHFLDNLVAGPRALGGAPRSKLALRRFTYGLEGGSWVDSLYVRAVRVC